MNLSGCYSGLRPTEGGADTPALPLQSPPALCSPSQVAAGSPSAGLRGSVFCDDCASRKTPLGPCSLPPSSDTPAPIPGEEPLTPGGQGHPWALCSCPPAPLSLESSPGPTPVSPAVSDPSRPPSRLPRLPPVPVACVASVFDSRRPMCPPCPPLVPEPSSYSDPHPLEEGERACWPWFAQSGPSCC